MPAISAPPKAVSKLIQVSQLDFDDKNPRFPEDIAKGPIDQLMQRFVRDERLLEIIESIGKQDFFPGEPLLVTKKGRRWTVVEGNRRLAALKLLSGEVDPPEGRISIENAIEAATYRPTEVACLEFDDQEKILRYLGFRHITGIKAWSALQKARYMQRLRIDNYQSVDYVTSLKGLAKETGSKPGYLGQMLTALALYEVAEEQNFFDLKVDADEIDFSVLSTALSYASITLYVGLESRVDASLKGLNEKHLADLISFLFVKGNNNKSIVGESRHLKKLAAVVTSLIAVKHLKKTGNLDEAFEYSKGPAEALSQALVHAERRIIAAWEWLPLAKKDITEAHRERIDEIYERAELIKEQIDSILDVTKTRNKPPRTRNGR